MRPLPLFAVWDVVAAVPQRVSTLMAVRCVSGEFRRAQQHCDVWSGKTFPGESSGSGFSANVSAVKCVIQPQPQCTASSAVSSTEATFAGTRMPRDEQFSINVSLVLQQWRCTDDVRPLVRAIASAVPHRLEQLQISGCHQLTTDAISDELKSCLRLRALCFQDCPLVTCRFLRHGAFRSLQVLDLRHGASVSDRDVLAAAELQELRELRLGNCADVTKIGVEALTTRCLQLRVFTASRIDKLDSSCARMFAALPDLQELRLGWCKSLNDEALRLLIQQARPVQHLALTGIPSLANSGIPSMTTAGTTLTTLKLGHGGMLGDAACDHLRTWRTLESLSLTGIGLVTDRGLSSLCSLRNLRELLLVGCSKVTDAAFSELKSLSELRVLSLRNFSGLTGEGIGQLAELPHLTRLDLAGCKMIDRRAFSALNNCKTMASLDITATAVGDAEVSSLAPLFGRLEELVVAECVSITEVGVISICESAPLLRVLNVSGTCKAGASINVWRALSQLTKLEGINIFGLQEFPPRRRSSE